MPGPMTARYSMPYVHGPARPADELLRELARLRDAYGQYPRIAADLAQHSTDLSARRRGEPAVRPASLAVAS